MGLIQHEITRLPNGLSTRPPQDIFNGLGFPDPTKFHTQFDDFDQFNPAAGTWVVTETQAGATQALADGDGGLLLLTNSAADNDVVQIQNAAESFTFELGKQCFFKARFQVSDATQSDVRVGIWIRDAASEDITDGVSFFKADGAATMVLQAEKNGAIVSGSVSHTLVAATMTEVAFFWDGVSRIYYAFDGAVRGYISPGVSLPDDEALAVGFFLQNGEAAAKTATIDYLFASKER